VTMPGQADPVQLPHTSLVRTAEFGANDDSMLAVTRDGTAHVWSMDGTPKVTLSVPNTRFARLSNEGNQLLTDNGKQIIQWEVSRGVEAIRLGSTGGIGLQYASLC